MTVRTDAPGNGPYEVCLAFFGRLVELGVTDVVASPGSRSTPLVLAADAVDLAVTMHIDERVGGFHALGLARATRRPVVLVCSSGTAGANYHPAVIEAHHTGVPLIVCTADRPPELRQWGAGQTIDQVHLFGTSVRWFFDMPVPGEVGPEHGSTAALRAVETSTAAAGPVHLNWPFREPLEPAEPVVAPTPRRGGRVAPRSLPSRRLRELAEAHADGLIVVGPEDLPPETAAEILGFGRRHGWPVIADPASGLRTGPHAATGPLVTTAELMFGSPTFADQLPVCDVIVRVGLAPTTKAYRLWLESNRPTHLVLVDPGADWGDPTGSVTEVVAGPLAGLFSAESDESAGHGARTSAWSDVWARSEADVAAAATSALAADAGELGAVAAALDTMAAAGPATLVCSNSMPIRALDFALRPRMDDIRVLANRGANGIDGVIATAAGVAAGSIGRHTWVLIGDVATVHDLGGLAAITRLGLEDVTVVVLDNDGGGIFSMLPVAQVIAPADFRRLFATPPMTDIAAIGAAMGYRVIAVSDVAELADLPDGHGRPRLVVVATTVAGMQAGAASLRAATAAALDR